MTARPALVLSVWLALAVPAWGQVGLTPVSGADGPFEVVEIDGVTVYRSVGTPGAYPNYLYFQADEPVQSDDAYVEITYLDIGYGETGVQYNAATVDYALADPFRDTYRLDTGRQRTAIFRLPDADFRGAQNLGADIRLVSNRFTPMHVVSAVAYRERPSSLPDLSAPALSFALDDRIVSTSVFHWYTPSAGQLSGPWEPLEGRAFWSGLPGWWRFQIEQMMAANIDVLYVHLFPGFEANRFDLFRALAQLREQGYDVPKVAPFLDPLITWFEQPKPDLATEAGKDELVSHYVRFFEQYFAANTDAHAADYLARIDGRPILNTWHVFEMANVGAFTRADLESRLRDALPQPVFDNGIYMVTTALNNPVFSFADERVPQFEINEYYWEVTHNGVTAAQLKGGYWDQNVRDPGDFLARDGGAPYAAAWDRVDADVDRVYVESWNEYDEGTGIYAGDVGPPLTTGSNTNTDVWSATDDPFEYIRTTAAGAARFNEMPDLDARVLAHTVPSEMRAGETVTARVTVRNGGDVVWTPGSFALAPANSEAETFADAVDVEPVPVFDGIVRGRPATFAVALTAPGVPGSYTTRWAMTGPGGAPFGDVLEVTVTVLGGTDSAEDTRPQATLSIGAPNPSRGSVVFEVELARAEHIRLSVYDALGRLVAVVADGAYPPGTHRATFDGQRQPGGIYLVRLEAGSARATRTITLLD